MGFGGLALFLVCLLARLDEKMGEWVVLMTNGPLINNTSYDKNRKKNFWFHYIVAQKFLTMPAQWSQKVGVKYVVS